MDLLSALAARARLAPQRVVLPEPEEANILLAARQAADSGVARPLLLGDPPGIEEAAERFKVPLAGMEIVDAADECRRAEWRQSAAGLFPDMSEKRIEKRLQNRLSVGSLLVASGRADAMVAGLTHTTQEVILAAAGFIPLREGVSKPYSLFLMRIPGYEGPEGEALVFADCGVAISPDAAGLADIALLAAEFVRTLFAWEPRVALLSFSTKASGYDESVKKVREALRIVREREPGLAIDGELQLDAAIVPAIAARKAPGEDLVAGHGNILVFPDLNSGNIAYKCVQRFARADAFGPFFLGLTKTASDLSRGASMVDVLGVITLASVHAQQLAAGPASHPARRP
jgi:phosphate acetyltransferase